MSFTNYMTHLLRNITLSNIGISRCLMFERSPVTMWIPSHQSLPKSDCEIYPGVQLAKHLVCQRVNDILISLVQIGL